MSDFKDSDLYRELVKLCEKHNMPSQNLMKGFYVPEEVEKKYQELREEANNVSRVWRQLNEDIEIDENQVMKTRIMDLGVKQKKGIVKEEYADIDDLCNKNNLVKVPKGSSINKTGFEFRDHYLIFPNVMINNYHLMRWIVGNWSEKDFQMRVEINPDRVGIPGSEKPYMQANYWRGPEDLEHVKDSFERENLAVYGNGNFKGGLNDKTEFYFEERNGKYHLEIEELIPHQNSFIEPFNPRIRLNNREIDYFTRYVHAVTDEDMENCEHIDLAFREYESEENFKNRNLEHDLTDDGIKNMCARHKFLRFDSETGVPEYQELIGLFFQMNPYVLEFFEGETEFSEDIQKRRIKSLNQQWENDSLPF